MIRMANMFSLLEQSFISRFWEITLLGDFQRVTNFKNHSLQLWWLTFKWTPETQVSWKRTWFNKKGLWVCWAGGRSLHFPLTDIFSCGTSPQRQHIAKGMCLDSSQARLGLLPSQASLLLVTGACVCKAQDAANATPNQLHSWVASLVIKSQHDEGMRALHLIAMAHSPTGGGIQAWHPN